MKKSNRNLKKITLAFPLLYQFIFHVQGDVFSSVILKINLKKIFWITINLQTIKKNSRFKKDVWIN